MNLNVLPHVMGIGLAGVAFAVSWVAGLLSGVPAPVVSLRAAVAAIVFWLLGLLAGRMLVNGLCEAVTERLRATQEKPQPEAKANHQRR